MYEYKKKKWCNEKKKKEGSQSEIKQGEIYVHLIILYWKEKESQLFGVKLTVRALLYWLRSGVNMVLERHQTGGKAAKGQWI